jgi:hypothetical protein
MSDSQERKDVIEVTYSAGDIAALNLLIWSYWTIFIGIMAAILIALPIVFGLIDGYSLEASVAWIDWQFTAVVLAALIAWLLLTTVFCYWWRRRQGLHGPIHFSLTDEGVTFRNRQMNGSIFWSAIKSIKSRDERLFLFMTRRSALIFPRRAFDSDSEFKSFAADARKLWQEHHAH